MADAAGRDHDLDDDDLPCHHRAQALPGDVNSGPKRRLVEPADRWATTLAVELLAKAALARSSPRPDCKPTEEDTAF